MMIQPQPQPQRKRLHRFRHSLQSLHGCVGISIRVFFFLFGLLGVAFSVLTMDTCEFVKYTPREPPEGVIDGRYFNVTSSASVGLFRYDPDNEGCRDIDKREMNISWTFTTARICSVLATILACVALLLSLVDFSLCRFVLSRALISALFLLAFIVQCLTMLVYASQVCKPNYKSGPYPCTEEAGTWYSVVAICIYILCSAITCCMPKPTPLCIQLRTIHHNEKHDKDVCCFLCRKVDHEEEEDGTDTNELDNDDDELLLLLTPEQFIQQQHSQAAMTTALISARHGKQEEIERQLLLMQTYGKQLLPPEDYQQRATKLLLALPDPDTYDTYTKTTELVRMDRNGKNENQHEHGSSTSNSDHTDEETFEEAQQQEQEDEVDAEELRNEKRRMPVMRAIGAGAAATAAAVKRPFERKSNYDETA